MTAGAAGAGEEAGPTRPRLEWLDFYRGLAVLVMIETHVVNTFLAAGTVLEPWRAHLDYANGLVAPSFLFIAGFAQGLGRRRQGARAWPRLRRLGWVAAVGYLMHLPINALWRADWAEAWRLGTQMDVLVCLAVSLAALVILERICGRAVNAGVAVALAVVLLLAPSLVAWTAGPAPLVAAVNQTTGSLFPLLPWAAFVFAGFGASQRAASWRGMLPLIAACGAFVAWVGRGALTNVSSAFFFERLAWVLALVPVCAWLSARWSPAAVLFAGRESFVVYLVHLALIEVLALAGRHHLGLPATAALYPVVLGGSFALAWLWRRFSGARADRARRAARPPESSAPAA